MKEIILWFSDRIVPLLPELLLRALYPREKVAKGINISLHGEQPISPSLGSSVPHVDVHMEITNITNLDLTLERMLIELWFGQPVLTGAVLTRYRIPRKSSNSDVLFRSHLSSKQIQQIEPYLHGSASAGPIILSTRSYFESKVGVVEVEQTFRRTNV